jgi:adenylate cyclase
MKRQWPRILVTLLPLLLALLHASGVLRVGFIQRVDDIIYDARLRATMPSSMDDRIVVLDIDEKSLAEVGRWPWARNRLADLMDELFDRQRIALVGFDVVFAEPDESSGLKRLKQLAEGELKGEASFAAKLGQLQGSLDYDARFAESLKGRAVVLGYYFTSDRDGRVSGSLPEPVMTRETVGSRLISFTSWSGYGANLPILSAAAPAAGFFNSITESDGVVRSVPLVAEYKGRYYESLALSMFRALIGQPAVSPGFPQDVPFVKSYQGLESILLKQDGRTLAIPVDARVSSLVPFRGYGGPSGGSYQYVSVADVLAQRLPPKALEGKVVLLGTTAPGLLDLRVTPVGETYPGVEVHANVLSGLLTGNLPVKPDYTVGYEVILLLVVGLLLAFLLPHLSALVAISVSMAMLVLVVGMNFMFYLGAGLVFPLATVVLLIITAFALNMSYGYFVESRSKRQLANLFGTYVPPELVDEMVKDPASYSMQATNKELTVMFCDIRGFTTFSERMSPIELQQLLNQLFTRFTEIIRGNRGTIDKYMGDCIMAFWGAPVDSPNHAALAVKSSMEMARAVGEINAAFAAKGWPSIGVGIGVNTGLMCVGDMGSRIRQAYTVLGDAVNLGSRVESLSRVYGVDIVATESTRKAAGDVVWQELDRVRVKGKEDAVTIYTAIDTESAASAPSGTELKTWAQFLKSYRAQDWDQAEVALLNLRRISPGKPLYQLFSERVQLLRAKPMDLQWDGTFAFDNK